jgi:hypothetical protein
MPPYTQRGPDWLLGGRGKRRILEAFLLGEQPGAGWTRTELAAAAGQHRKARIDLYVEPLVELGLLIEEAGRYRLAPDSDLAPPLRNLLAQLRER